MMNYPGVSGAEGTIMAKIMELTAPPTYEYEDEDPPPPSRDNPAQKRNNRTHPKGAFCDGCVYSDPGEMLLSCVSCPVYYHPICDEPPLVEEVAKDIEDWKCRCCRNKEMLTETEKTEVKRRGDGRKRKLRSRNRVVKIEPPNREDECVDEEVEPAEENVEKENKDEESDDGIKDGSEQVAKKIVNLFSKAVTTAKTINPVTFEIPESCNLNEHAFPGTSRSEISKPEDKKSKPQFIELVNEKVPLPISVCFNCTKSCRLAPLLQCDYCPKLFHFDCLNPPLTCPPVGLWMCPLHVEPFLESKQLKSCQLSQRVRIWDLSHTQVDRSTVYLNFLQKCSRKDPPFSSKVPVSIAVPYLVPEGCGNHVIKTDVMTERGSDDATNEVLSSSDNEISSLTETARKQKLFKCYEKRTSSKIPELTTLKESLLEGETSDATEQGPPDDATNEVLFSDDDEISSLTETARKQEHFKCYEKRTSSKIPELTTLRESLLEGETSDATEHGPPDDATNEVLSSGEDEVSSFTEASRKQEHFKCYEKRTSSKIPELTRSKESLLDDGPSDTSEDWQSHVWYIHKPEAQLGSEVIRDEPKPESCGIERETKNPSPSRRSDFLVLFKACELLTEEEERRMAHLKRLSMDEVYLLAAQRLEEVEKMSHPAPNPMNPVITQSNKKSSTVKGQPIAKAVIQFYCLNAAKLIKFSTQSIVIGTDHVAERGSTTLNPKRFVNNCKRLSGFHAVIFYDRSHLRWEILNYSQYGIIIDSVLYSLKPPIDKDDEPRNDIEAVKSLINERRGVLLAKARNPRVDNTQELNCECENAASSPIVEVTHEGSAMIAVGSEIQIGCLKLVVKCMETEEVMAYACAGIPK